MLPAAVDQSPVVARAAAALMPLRELDPATYARSHAAFEARSDQRALVAAWLSARLAPRRGPVRVLSVGCGDGTLDAVLADGLTAGGGEVCFDGIEPFAGSADRWQRALAAVPGVQSRVSRCTLAEHVRTRPDEPPYDVVLAVHSLYYVADLPQALTAALRLVAPGGELVVLHAPRAELNALVTLLAPRSSGHPQWFSETVAAALAGLDAPVQHDRLLARLDLAEAADDVLDFAVQAVLPGSLREVVRDHLRDLRLPGAAFEVPHPVDAFVVGRPPG